MVTVANENDVAALNILVNSGYRGNASRKGWTTEADLLDGIRTDEDGLKKMMQQQETVILKYIEDDKLLGCVYLKKENNKMYLGMLTVFPELQNKGIGKILLAASEDYAKANNCNAVFMTVISRRTELIDWYNKRGYINTGKTKPFPKDDIRFGIPKVPLEFIVLEKKLN